MTKVSEPSFRAKVITHHNGHDKLQLYFAVNPDPNVSAFASGKTPEELGIINQHGLNRKVGREYG